MFGKAHTVSDLSIDVSLNGGISIIMNQVSPVVVTCTMDGAKIVRIHADEGIEFLSEGGFIGVEYKPGYDITELCNRRSIEKELRQIAEEND
jgi:spore germination protein GerM